MGAKLCELIGMLQPIINARNYTDMKNALSAIKTVSIRAVKDCDELKKNRVSAIKKSVTEAIKPIKEMFDQDLDELFEDMKKSKAGVDMIIRLTLDFMQRFKSEKTEKGIIDFTDQAHYAMEILTVENEYGKLIPSETARHIAKNYKEIMIDEYQDSNYIQEAILTSVANGDGVNNMFMVGDVKQSIYRFRQAEPKLFLGKYYVYSEDSDSKCRKIILDDNFRSRREVIESVNFIFDYIMHRGFGGIDYKNGNRLSLGATYNTPPEGQNNETEFIVIEGDDKKIEAEYVAQKIREITNPVTGMKITEENKNIRPVRYSDIAILLRTMKGNSEIYQEQLENNGIPTYAETKTGYYQALEVKTIISMLSIIDNPLQDIPLAAVLVSPMYSFTSNELAMIKAENLKDSFFDSVESYAENGSDKRLSDKIRVFLHQLNKFRNMVPYTGVYEMINEILKDTGYDYYIRSMVNGKRRYYNIEALKEKAVAYDSISYKGLFNFIRYIEKLQYLAKDDGEASTVSENDNLVQIMSIHKSKGLQFPIVFVCNNSGGSKNDINRIVTDDDGNIGVDCIDNKLKIKAPTIIKKVIKLKNKEEEKAEQLRILYVALTRAKEKLFITGLSKNVEETLGQFLESRYDDSDVLPYGEVFGAKNFMEWIGKSVARNKAFDSVIEDEIKSNNDIYNVDSHIKVKKVCLEDIVFADAVNEVYDDIKKEMLNSLGNIRLIDEEAGSKISERFDFRYPFKEDITLHSKASVTEVKKQNMAYEEEQDGQEMYSGTKAQHSTELPEIVPNFAKENVTTELFGAKRGTAYHRVFELLNMGLDEYNEVNVQNMLEGFVAGGLLGRDEADSINASDIVAFTKSKLFDRMRAADKRGELFRERKFLMGVPAKEINAKSDSDETMIVQGIIDVCFIEDGKYVIADYKTDKVSQIAELNDRYHIQLECYKHAIEQISEIKVSEMIIYSVTLGEEMTL